MLIDFHVHFFPDAIARASVEKLAHNAGAAYYGDGTLGALVSFMKEDGVTVSVNQPVATKPEQVQSINRKMIGLRATHPEIVSFGAMHPGFAGYAEELAFLKQNGIPGIKIHPDYQDFCPEDPRFRPILESCARLGLAVLFHAGVDLAYPEVHCTPRGLREVLEIPGLTVICAHMGGYKLWDDVEKYLVGKNVYLDLAYCRDMDDARLTRMIEAHGHERILFASDFPWERARAIKDKVDSLPFGDEARANIFHRNASRLLNLPL